MSLNAFAENMVLTYAALGLLGMIFLVPVAIGFIEGEGSIIERLLLGFTHFFEAFISFLTNSVSYIRLAAFALSHGAFALCAAILAGIIGGIPSYVIINVLVFLIEGMSVGIQSMRLMYYEFFTKFYTGDGKPYRPFQLKATRKT
jgi:V/A-type H+-transporting ATPase subunit I